MTAQDPDGKANYGEKKLEAGFEPDPFVVNVDAGGAVQTNLGGVKAFVDKNPDFRLVYENAGKFPLTIYVESQADTTLLVNDPDGKWLANDDTNGLNPQIKIAQPKSGRYEIWVGTFNGGATPPAKLFITELK